MRSWKATLACGLTVVASLLALGAVANPAFADNGSCPRRTNYCIVHEPYVTVPSHVYPNVHFFPGDSFIITAGGCVQTGGAGLTWKRYVDPYSDNGLYHGLIRVAGAGGVSNMVRLLYVANQGQVFTATVETDLVLGYEDDNYSDNGYYAHDNGTGGQCRNVGNAWVTITFVGAGSRTRA